MQASKLVDFITKWLKDYKTNNSSIKGFVVGVSGGIDSALVSTLCARTGLPVLVLELPIHQSKPEVQRSTKHVAWLKQQFGDNVRSHVVDLTNAFEAVKKTLTGIEANHHKDLALANVRSRLRMTTLYYFAQLHEYIVVGTGNKVEDFGIGFFTKYGDGGVDISPIADLLKSEVSALAVELGVTQEIIDAKPTDGLFGDARTDEDQIGAAYDEIEWIMKQKDAGIALTDTWSDREKEVWHIFEKRNQANQHKMKEAPRCIIPNDLKE